MPFFTTAWITAFRPGQSPPPVNIPIRIAVSLCIGTPTLSPKNRVALREKPAPHSTGLSSSNQTRDLYGHDTGAWSRLPNDLNTVDTR